MGDKYGICAVSGLPIGDEEVVVIILAGSSLHDGYGSEARWVPRSPPLSNNYDREGNGCYPSEDGWMERLAWEQIQLDPAEPLSEGDNFEEMMEGTIPYGIHKVVDRKGERPVPLRLAVIRRDVWDPMMKMTVGKYTLESITLELRKGLDEAIKRVADEVEWAREDGKNLDRKEILWRASYRLPYVMIPDDPGRAGLATSFTNFAYLCATRAILQEDIAMVVGKFAELCLMRILMGRLNREWAPSPHGPQAPNHKVIAECCALFSKLAKKAARRKNPWGDE